MVGNTGSAAATGSASEYRQSNIVGDLPPAKIVDRLHWLTEQRHGRRVIHIGFADTGFRDEQDHAG